jgi:hypothetical protein
MADLTFFTPLEIPAVELDDTPDISVSPGWVNGVNMITEQGALATSLVGTYSTLATDVIGQFRDLLVADELPTGWEGTLADVIINPVPTIDVGTIPVPGGITLPGFENLVFPIMGTLREVPDINLDYTPPTAPTDVDPELTHVMSTYTSDMWSTLFNKIEYDILNGGTGLSADDQAARHALAAERKTAANEKAYLNSVYSVNSKALSCPQFMIDGIEAQMAAEVLRQEIASSNEIYIADGDLAQKNTQFAISTGLDIEKLLRAFWEMSEKMSFDFKKGVADFILSKFSEKNKAFLTQYQGITAMMQANIAAAEAIVAANKPIMDRFKIEMDGVLGEGDLIAKERESLVKIATTEADIYKTRVEAVSAYYNALSENQKAQIQKSGLDLQKAIAEIDFLLKSQVALASQRKEILATLGPMFIQITSAALNTVQTSVGTTANTSAQISAHWSNNKSRDERFGHDQNASENHTVSHKGADLT